MFTTCRILRCQLAAPIAAAAICLAFAVAARADAPTVFWASDPIRPVAWWAQGDRCPEASPDGWLRLFGKDFAPARQAAKGGDGPVPASAVNVLLRAGERSMLLEGGDRRLQREVRSSRRPASGCVPSVCAQRFRRQLSVERADNGDRREGDAVAAGRS
ncbi:MAG: hypothetical protein AUJ96_08280 [Armatimonadetes bacterium CG2_30_66_41]|nr:hypothetical protein [Armatimonadota bacterium]OIP07033.1 MAG: hypothetical protein AUJ96_08280 [Armatimonadetes bacterium CG2_30_66_41]NCO95978.1 hypothetical protein [Armatimonadota bacterium]NCP33260.1 hypothetical protein [Armatimonadota bacterium]NCQ32867.1 hypothetical protein [Armatimonadota bacterium]